MDLRQLAQFVAVAETGSFRRAAERLFMAQPPLSVAIRKLEQEVGVSLLERSPRGVELTPAGASALRMARRCLAAAAEIGVVARATAQGELGQLRVGFIGSVTFGLLPKLIKAFREQHPGIRLHLQEATNQTLIENIEAETLDVGFVRIPTARPLALTFQTVHRDHFVVVMPSLHPLASEAIVSVAQLAACPFVGYAPSTVGGLQAAVSQRFMTAGASPSIAQEAVQVQTVIGLVESGLGVALVPSINARGVSQSVTFRPLLNEREQPPIGIALAYRTDHASPAIGRLLETARAVHAESEATPL